MNRSLKTLCVLLVVAASPFAYSADWLQFRGPESRGVAAEAELPIQWDAERNVAWKADLPGRGLSSPIIIGKNVVVTCSSGVRQERLHVLCFDGDSGAKRWERQFWATGLTFCHPKTCVAAPTPASDGERIFAFYSSNDVFCLDLDGQLLWLRGLTHDYPNSSNSVGMTSSPVVIGKTLVVQLENETNSFAAGLDTETGMNRWKIPRTRKANWASPLAMKRPAIKNPDGDGQIVVLQSPDQITGHDPLTGEELWRHDAGCSSIPSSTADGNRLYVPSEGLTLLELDGESRTPKVIWKSKRIKLSTASPVAYQGRVYALSGSLLTCANRTDGEVLWKARLKGPFSGTPIIASGHLYAFNEDGVGQVVELGEGRVVSENLLGETFLCSPSAADGGLFVRSDQHLWKIAVD